MKKVCTLCGCQSYEAFAFKSGHVCETCLRHLKSDSQSRGDEVIAKAVEWAEKI